MLYMLDTSTASYIIKARSAAVRRRLVRVPMEELAISTVTEGELRFGVVRRPDATRLQGIVEEFLLHVNIMFWIRTLRSSMELYGPFLNAMASLWATSTQ